MTRWLIVVEGDIEPHLDGPYKNDQRRTAAARRHRGKDLVLLCYKKGAPQKGQPGSCRSKARGQWFVEGWRWTRGYAAPRAPGEPRGRKWRGRSATGKSTWPVRAEGEKRLRSATRNL
jgi:hypothetical protein